MPYIEKKIIKKIPVIILAIFISGCSSTYHKSDEAIQKNTKEKKFIESNKFGLIGCGAAFLATANPAMCIALGVGSHFIFDKSE